MGEEKLLTALLEESLSLATRSGAAKLADSSRVIVDTAVQPKAIAFRTDRCQYVASCARTTGASGT